MKQMYSNATVYWNEQEIEEREAITKIIYQILKKTWTRLNPAVKFCRIETPILTPESYLKGHTDEGFPMIQTEHGYLRPEIAGGCFQAFFDIFPQENQRNKLLPICIWQTGKSFRDEKTSDTMRASKLRLREFWQLEFELICAESTKANYMERGIEAIQTRFSNMGNENYLEEPTDLPHYSIKTIDWHINKLEVAGCSIRNDLPGYQIHEISIGLDRLLGLI
jgi:glycyl-tRNA synthetase (class II)